MDKTLVPDLINARYGWGIDENYLSELGKKTIDLEREFNRLAGFTPADDRLPEWMTREKLPPNDAVFDVPERELDSIFD
jgi:aldehyde:ferredoxin oxidoreductase